MKTHFLKTWPDYYQKIITGQKPFEIRKNDRDFHEGDKVILQEWDPISEKYTGASAEYRIGPIVQDVRFGLRDGFCAFGLLPPLWMYATYPDEAFCICPADGHSELCPIHKTKSSPR